MLNCIWTNAKSPHVCTCARLRCLDLKHSFHHLWTPSTTLKRCSPSARIIQLLLFFPVFTPCALLASVTTQRGPVELGHMKPQIVLIQLPTLRLDNSPWREGAREMDWAPGADSHHSPDRRGCDPHSWALSPVPVLLVTLGLQSPNGRWLFYLSSLKGSSHLCDRTSGGTSPEMCRTSCFALAERTSDEMFEW